MSELEKFIKYIKQTTEIDEAQTTKIPLKNFGGKVLGYIECNSDGDQKLTDYGGFVLGRYIAKSNTTQDYGGKVLTRGNTLTMLLK
jgi:hypothetical protein